jgi:hypothetical protein
MKSLLWNFFKNGLLITTFIGTRFSNLYTAVDTPASGGRFGGRGEKVVVEEDEGHQSGK